MYACLKCETEKSLFDKAKHQRRLPFIYTKYSLFFLYQSCAITTKFHLRHCVCLNIHSPVIERKCNGIKCEQIYTPNAFSQAEQDFLSSSLRCWLCLLKASTTPCNLKAFHRPYGSGNSSPLSACLKAFEWKMMKLQ